MPALFSFTPRSHRLPHGGRVGRSVDSAGTRVYVLGLLFSFKTHKSLFRTSAHHGEPKWSLRRALGHARGSHGSRRPHERVPGGRARGDHGGAGPLEAVRRLDRRADRRERGGALLGDLPGGQGQDGRLDRDRDRVVHPDRAVRGARARVRVAARRAIRWISSSRRVEIAAVAFSSDRSSDSSHSTDAPTGSRACSCSPPTSSWPSLSSSSARRPHCPAPSISTFMLRPRSG